MPARLGIPLLCTGLALISACDRGRPGDSAGAPATHPMAISFGAFHVDVPPGWTRDTPDRQKTIAMFRLNGAGWQDADGLIMVDVGRPTASVPQLAKSLAGVDGTVRSDPESIDGADGIRVETTSTDLSRPRHAVAVERGGQVYLIMAAQRGGTDVSGAFEQLVASWRWTDGQ